MVEDDHQNTWFEDRTQGLWNKHLLPYKDLVDQYLEIGVCAGKSMQWILENMQPSVAYGVDPWHDPGGKKQPVFDAYKQECYQRLDKWIPEPLTIVEATSQEFFCSALLDDSLKESFDLIYIDGDHGGYECMLDMLLAYQLLKRDSWEHELSTYDKKGREGRKTPVGGIMVIDDLQRCWLFGKPLVKIAVWQFELLMHGKMFKLWEDGRQVAFVRVS